jgi:hydroxyacylglutathione hydrolase
MSNLACTPIAGLDVHRLPAFTDNYLWLLQSGPCALVVDPGDADVIDAALHRSGLALAGILVTHHHLDHIGGVAALAAKHACPVYGAADPRIPGVTATIGEGDVIRVDGFPDIAVWQVPGHTRTHLAFVAAGAIFVGDVLFGAGCGRVIDGEMNDLFRSLQRIAALPDDTWIFCAHDYTRANLAFAAVVEPDNAAIRARQVTLADGAPTVPFRLVDERASNVFLRCDQAAVAARVSARAHRPLDAPADVFAVLRQWKDVHV